MPIVNHDLVPTQFAGIQRAHFEISRSDDQEVEVPLTGPKQIRRIVVVTGNNSAAGGTLTLAIKDAPGGNVIGAAKDIKLVEGSFVKWEESELAVDYKKMGTAYDGLCFAVVNAAGADAWTFQAEVLFSPRTNGNNRVYVDEKLEGLV